MRPQSLSRICTFADFPNLFVHSGPSGLSRVKVIVLFAFGFLFSCVVTELI